MDDSMTHVGPSISELDIRRFEKRFGITFPERYKQFLFINNGGAPTRKFFQIQGFENNPIGQVQLFFGINSPIPSRNLDWNYETFDGRIPSQMLPIARDDGGNLICIALGSGDNGAVLFWDHNSEGRSENGGNFYRISDGFAKFLESMYSEA